MFHQCVVAEGEVVPLARYEDVWRMPIELHLFLTSTLYGTQWSSSRPGHFTPGERTPSTQCPVDWLVSDAA